MSEAPEKSDRLARGRPPLLEGALAFRVFPTTESDPQECGELHVVLDEEQISLWFTGDSKEKFTGKWADLRWLLRNIRDQETKQRIEQARRERAQSERVSEAERKAAIALRKERDAWNARKRGATAKKAPT